MKIQVLTILATLFCASSVAQVAIVNTLSNLLSRPVGRASQSVDVLRLTDSIHWKGPKRWVWNYTNDLDTNSVWNGKVLMRSAATNIFGTVGRWEHEFTGDPQALGAAGNGVADDWLPLQAAINGCKIAGMQLYLPAGTYRITASLDCRNSGDNAMEFAGIRGDGLTLTKIIADHNDPILKIQGRGGEYSGFRIGYSALNANSTANAITGYGFVYFHSFRDIEVINGYRGLFSDPSTGSSFFSCTFDPFIIRSSTFAHGDIQSSSGSVFNNLYLSSPGSSGIDIAWRDRAGGGYYGLITIEHSNIRDCALRIFGDGAAVGKLRFEGNRFVTDANWIDLGGNGLVIDSLEMVNNFGSGHILSGITSNGVATVDVLGQAVTAGHGFYVGDTVTIGGATPSGYSGSFVITAVTPTTFSYTPTGSPGVNASTNWVAGQDCIWAYVGSFPAPAIAATETYGGGKLTIKHLSMRNNKVNGHTSTIRNTWGNDIAREFGGKRLQVDVGTVSQGSQFRVGDQVIGFNPIIASSVTNSVATVYLKYPHEMSQGQYASISGGVNLDFGTNYIQVAGVPDQYTLTFASAASNAGLTIESGNLIPVKARVTFRTRTNDLATLTTDVAHQLSRGSRVLVRISTNTYAKSEALVTAVPTTNSFSYVSIAADEPITAEPNGMVYEFSSGLTATLQSSSTVGLRTMGNFFDPRVSVPTHVLAANSSTSMVFTVNGVRPNATVTVTPFYFHALTPGTRYTAGVSTNDVVLLVSENLTGSVVTNNVNILKLHIQ